MGRLASPQSRWGTPTRLVVAKGVTPIIELLSIILTKIHDLSSRVVIEKYDCINTDVETMMAQLRISSTLPLSDMLSLVDMISVATHCGQGRPFGHNGEASLPPVTMGNPHETGGG
jgi:dGTP triphosphohydrolase